MENFDFDLYESLIFPCRGRVLSSESLVNIYLNDNNNSLEKNCNSSPKRGSTKELESVYREQKVKEETFNSNGNKKFTFKPSYFKSNSSLEIEEKPSSEKGEGKTFICSHEGCQKAYKNKSRLQIHKRTHSGIKPFKCNKCSKAFNEKGNLMTHMRIHTGEKPYKCSYEGCKKEFKAYGHLSDHLKRHYNIRPYECHICKSCFSRRNTLKTHMMTHTGEKPFVCSFPGCQKRFSEKGNMKTHYKTHLKKIHSECYEEMEGSPCFIINRCHQFCFLGKKSNRNKVKCAKKTLEAEKEKGNNSDSTNACVGFEASNKGPPTILEQSGNSPDSRYIEAKVQAVNPSDIYLDFADLIEKFSESQDLLFSTLGTKLN